MFRVPMGGLVSYLLSMLFASSGVADDLKPTLPDLLKRPSVGLCSDSFPSSSDTDWWFLRDSKSGDMFSCLAMRDGSLKDTTCALLKGMDAKMDEGFVEGLRRGWTPLTIFVTPVAYHLGAISPFRQRSVVTIFDSVDGPQRCRNTKTDYSFEYNEGGTFLVFNGANESRSEVACQPIRCQ